MKWFWSRAINFKIWNVQTSYSTVQKSELISLYDGSKAVHERSQFCVSSNKVTEQVTGNYDHIHVQEYSDIIRTGNYPLISSNWVTSIRHSSLGEDFCLAYFSILMFHWEWADKHLTFEIELQWMDPKNVQVLNTKGLNQHLYRPW